MQISQDTLYNLHEIAYDLPGFIFKITTFWLEKLLTECDRVLHSLSYDTTFQLGDFYVTHYRDTWRECCKQVPSLRTTEFPIVADKEKSRTNTNTSELPTVRSLYCWNHIFSYGVANMGAPKADISVHSKDLCNLFHCSSYVEYQKLLTDKRKVVFEDYYMKEIHPESGGLSKNIQFIIPTNNQSESMNRQVRYSVITCDVSGMMLS